MHKDDIKEISMAKGSWGKVRAYATVTFTNGLTLEGVKLIEGNKGLFCGMPSVQRKNKESGEMEWKDCSKLTEDGDYKAFLDILTDHYNGDGSSSSASSGGSNEDDPFDDDDEF